MLALFLFFHIVSYAEMLLGFLFMLLSFPFLSDPRATICPVKLHSPPRFTSRHPKAPLDLRLKRLQHRLLKVTLEETLASERATLSPLIERRGGDVCACSFCHRLREAKMID